MKILVADDEALARARIIKLLKESEYDFEVFAASTGKETIDLILNQLPDLLFLDIQMTDMSGFDVLRKIYDHHMPVIIFVTAYDTFAVQAFAVQALDFLLKPFKNDRFFEALDRGVLKIKSREQKVHYHKMSQLLNVLKNEQAGIEPLSRKYLDKVVLKAKNKYYFIPVHSIKYILSSTYYAEIITLENKKHLYRISLTDFIEKLNPDNFIRVNRSTIINLKELKEVISEGQSEYSIVMRDNMSFSLTKNYKKDFLEMTNIK
jgi:two-component system LytT family response regulator